MTTAEEDQMVKAAVDRFLSWRVPDDFSPDGWVEFTRPPDGSPEHFWPVGTNLLTDQQAEQMVRHILGLD